MSYENFVRVKVVTPVTNVATSFAILDAVAPQKLPPTDGGYLVLCDSPGNPSWIEVIKYTSRSGLGISGVTRGQEGTTAVAWTGNVYAFQALMASEANLIQTTLAGKEPAISTDTTAKFWRGDKVWTDFATTVRATVLTGLSLATGTAITAADTVLSGLGKLQKQISDAATNLAANVRAVVLTGYVAGSNTALAATDTVLAAFGKVQGQLNAKANAANAALTGVPTMPTAATGTNTLQGANTAFVQQEIAVLINSAPGALDTLNELAAAMGDDPNFAATMTTALAGKEPSIASDVVTKFWSGTKTWRDLATDVRAVVLTGLSVASGTAVTASDTLLVAIGKLQKQCTDRLLLSGGTMTGAINEALVSLASAATVNIGAAAGNIILISGTTTITAFDVAPVGVRRKVYFSSALTLTHNATTLNLPGSANITTVSGDSMEMLSNGGGNWICLGFWPFDGMPVRTVAVNHGGTGATTAAGARTNLGLGSSATVAAAVAATADTMVQRGNTGEIQTGVIYCNASIELGRMDGVASVPLIDFHAGATATDYDARIIGTTPTGVAGGGKLDYIANGGHAFSGAVTVTTTIYSGSTMNAAGGLYDNGSRAWSTANFDPNTKMRGTTGALGATNGVCSIAAARYDNFSVPQQVYNGAIEIREAGLVQTGGPAPAHIYNAPGISFYWAGHYISKLMINSTGNLCWGDPAGAYNQIAINGNINGGAWGGWLSDFLTNYFLQKGNTMAQIAQMSDCTAVGGIALMKNVVTAIGLNQTVPASYIAWSDNTGGNYGAPQGTWKSMGYVAANASGIFMRIA